MSGREPIEASATSRGDPETIAVAGGETDPSRLRPWKRLLTSLLGLRDRPEKIARGVSLGVFIAFTPTLGLQMLMVLGTAPLVRANRAAALSMVWLSNPLTIAPLCYVWYRIGVFLTARETMDYDRFRALLPGPDMGLGESFSALFEQLGWPLWIGSLAFAAVAALICYPLTVRWLRRRAAREAGVIGAEAATPAIESPAAPATTPCARS